MFSSISKCLKSFNYILIRKAARKALLPRDCFAKINFNTLFCTQDWQRAIIDIFIKTIPYRVKVTLQWIQKIITQICWRSVSFYLFLKALYLPPRRLCQFQLTGREFWIHKLWSICKAVLSIIKSSLSTRSCAPGFGHMRCEWLWNHLDRRLEAEL